MTEGQAIPLDDTYMKEKILIILHALEYVINTDEYKQALCDELKELNNLEN